MVVCVKKVFLMQSIHWRPLGVLKTSILSINDNKTKQVLNSVPEAY